MAESQRSSFNTSSSLALPQRLAWTRRRCASLRCHKVLSWSNLRSSYRLGAGLTRLLRRPLGIPEAAGLNDRMEVLREELGDEAAPREEDADEADPAQPTAAAGRMQPIEGSTVVRAITGSDVVIRI